MKTREQKIIRTSIIGIIGNILLVIGKGIVGLIAHSVSIISDAINNLTDALSSLITLIGTKLSTKKPDSKHPFGHGRVEYITSAVIGLLILFAGFSAIFQSIQSIISGEKATYSLASVIVISIAILGKLALGLYFRHMGKVTNSENLKASSIDALFDVLLSVSTLVGIIFAMTLQINIEGWLGILIGGFILKSGFEVLFKAISVLVGEKNDKELVLGIKKIVTTHKEVKGAYDLIINNYGVNRSFASIHIEVDDDLPAKRIHQISREISEEVYYKYNVILTVGVYAQNEGNEEVKQIKKDVYSMVKAIKEITQIHGFYVNEDKKQVYFDILFDFKCDKQKEIVDKLQNDLHELHHDYIFLIVVDMNFTD